MVFLQICGVVLTAVVAVLATCFQTRENGRLSRTGFAFIGLTVLGVVLAMASIVIARRDEVARDRAQAEAERTQADAERWDAFSAQPVTALGVTYMTGTDFSARQLGWIAQARLEFGGRAFGQRIVTFGASPRFSPKASALVMVCKNGDGRELARSHAAVYVRDDPATRGRIMRGLITMDRLPEGALASGASGTIAWDGLGLGREIRTVGDVAGKLAYLRVEMPTQILDALTTCDVLLSTADGRDLSIVLRPHMSRHVAYAGFAGYEASANQVAELLRESFRFESIMWQTQSEQ